MVSLRKVLPADTDFDAWLATLQVNWTSSQLEVVHRAYALATMADQAQPEKGLFPGLAIADILADLRMDYAIVAAALLYDAVVQGRLSIPQLEEGFGATIARLVDGVNKLDIIGDFQQQGEHRQLESLRRMLLALAQDIRVVLIKLAMQLYQVRTLNSLPEDQRRRIAQETLDIFAPLANRLGIGRIKWELEDLALRHLDSIRYKDLARALDERRADRERYISQVVGQLQGELRRAGIKAEVQGRAKHIYSIWRKMQRKQLPFHQIFDVRALRIMVHSVADCYAALGVVHSLWNHIPREFDDYIANPKDNGYQSLHTAVVGPQGKTLEVQIRTYEMHQGAELGVAAHWRYKEGGTQGAHFERQIAWLRQILEWKDEKAEISDFLDRFKAEAFQDRVYVFTPKGAIVELPQGATALDFAYYIHTEVGHRCRGAKVNGRIVPLTYELKNGEQVEILTTKTPAPSRDWMNHHLGYLKTSRARAKVRHWFTQQNQEKSITAGRAALEREFQRLGVKQISLEPIAEKLNFSKPDELYAAVGRGDLTTSQVAAVAQDLIFPTRRPEETLPITRKSRVGEGGGEIQIRGVGNLLTQLAHCCKPVPYDSIVGFITRGRGVTIHRQDCANLFHLASRHRERLIEVDWGDSTKAVYAVNVEIDAYDRPGLLRDITSILANEQVNVLAANTLTDPKSFMARLKLVLEIADVGQLSRILDRIGQLPNVQGVRRKG